MRNEGDNNERGERKERETSKTLQETVNTVGQVGPLLVSNVALNKSINFPSLNFLFLEVEDTNGAISDGCCV